jgi:hypothetical protein
MSYARWPAGILLSGVLAGAAVVAGAATDAGVSEMTVVAGRDVSGTLLKKLGLPNRQYCWDACLKDDRCSGVRWGVVGSDTAGLCLLMSGPLTLKDPVEPKTDDGKAIHITVARKDPATGGARN